MTRSFVRPFIRSFVCLYVYLFIRAVFVRVWPEQCKAMALFEGSGLRKMTMLYLLSVISFCHSQTSPFFWSFPTCSAVKVDAFFQRLNDAEDQDLATFAMLNHLAVKKTLSKRERETC